MKNRFITTSIFPSNDVPHIKINTLLKLCAICYSVTTQLLSKTVTSMYYEAFIFVRIEIFYGKTDVTMKQMVQIFNNVRSSFNYTFLDTSFLHMQQLR